MYFLPRDISSSSMDLDPWRSQHLEQQPPTDTAWTPPTNICIYRRRNTDRIGRHRIKPLKQSLVGVRTRFRDSGGLGVRSRVDRL